MSQVYVSPGQRRKIEGQSSFWEDWAAGVSIWSGGGSIADVGLPDISIDTAGWPTIPVGASSTGGGVGVPPMQSLPTVVSGTTETTATAVLETAAEITQEVSLMDDWDFGLGWDDVISIGREWWESNTAQPAQPVVIDGGGGVVGPGGGSMPMPVASGDMDPRNRYCMVFDKKTNQWVWKIKSRRRRKRRLASTSDIKDLAALKSVLGNGENLKTWIATHG